MKPAAKKTLWITGGVVALLLVGVAALGMFWVRQAKDALDQMAQPATPQREIGVYVLEDDPAQPRYILTRRGAGYYFQSDQ